MTPARLCVAVATCVVLVAVAPAQFNQGSFLKTKLVERFDKDKNGRLDKTERAAARKAMEEDPALQRTRRRMRTRQPLMAAEESDDPPILPSGVRKYPKSKLYDGKTLRTLFLYFPEDGWYEELLAFYRTDVDVPANLVVDGKKIFGVGVRFRGSSSYLMAARTKKKPINLSLDHTDPKARFLGYRTLNLLNGNQDPSFLREVIFSHVASKYLPVPRSNFVRLVINGEDWGIYQSSQQYNRDFLRDWYGDSAGVRWNPLRSMRATGGLRYLGEEQAVYEVGYELRTQDKGAWQRLMHFCKVLSKTEPDKLEAVLPKYLDIDEALWFCALEVAFLAGDGYVNQGYDYRLYEDKNRRFHLIPYDNNEILPSNSVTRGYGARTMLGLDASPLFQADNPQRPIMHQLMKVSAWRARYLAHMRTIAMKWLDWKRLGKVCQAYHDLIRDVVETDTKKMFSTEQFLGSLEQQEPQEQEQDPEQGMRNRRRRMRPLKDIVEERQKNLLSHPTMQGPWPTVKVASKKELGTANGKSRVQVTAKVGGQAKIQTVLLYYTQNQNQPYRTVAMLDDGKHGDGASGDGVYGATTPFLPKKRLRFYVEARGEKATAFDPAKAESGPRSHKFRKE